uniref:Putative P22-like portal protein n=1 Tax=viral metagenome TaxID=1070528 RepID=A0A6M3K7T7_9ZZZZ
MSKHEDILTLAVTRYKAAIESDQTEREAYDDDIRFAINDEGCQWPAAIRASREGDNPPRPCLVFNKIPEKIDQVEGEFKQLKPSIKVRGVDSKADPKIAEILQGIINHIEYNSNARSAYNTAHTSTLYGGRGAWRIDIEEDDDDPFVRNIVINRIPNVLTVCWDPGAKKTDKSDAEYVFVSESISEKEFKAEYPGVEAMDWDSDDKLMEGWRTDKTIRRAEYWWKEKVEKTFYRVERVVDGVPIEMTVKEQGEGDLLIEEKKVKRPGVKWCNMIYNKVLEGPHDWPSKYIPIVIETGKEVNIAGQSKTRGMPRFAKDAQRMYDYFASASAESVALVPKVPYLVTPKMIGNHQSQWDQAATKNFMYLLYDADPLAPTLYPKREMPPQLSTAIAAELGRMEHDIMSAMNIYRESLGDESQAKSGTAINARQRQGNTGSYSYTDSFHVALTYSSKILIDLAPYVYDTERITRIRGEDDVERDVAINAREGAPILQGANQDFMVKSGNGYINDLSVGKYDVVATIGPSHATQRMETFDLIARLINSVPQFGLALGDILFKNMDVSGAEEAVKRLARMVPPEIMSDNPPEKPPDPKIMLEMKKIELKLQDQNRKDFETQMKAITELMKAEAAERGQQAQEMAAVMGLIKERLPPIGPQPGQGAQP